MSVLTGRVPRAFLLPAVLGLGALSLASASADPARTQQQAEQAPSVAQAGLKFGFYVGDEQQPTTSHVAKLDSDITFPQGRFDGMILGFSGKVPITGKLAIPPTSSYFVSFRFMPATGDVELIPDGDATGTVHVKTGNTGDCKAVGTRICADSDVTNKVFIKLSNVKVDGKVLDVGPNCRTAQSATVNIKALMPLEFPAPSVKVTSTFATPAFTGCGVREDLSPLLTGLVSGPGNTLVTNLKLRCVGSGGPPNGCGA
ncbi:hypothetical protein [Amycolatopsis regifaucium]|uniref:Secreted protein n=1 Tax=Amycolatopsis regifaucium TaxID=546365 RepID=A0A154M5B7_9PSEU|nr:hypothetical protein [Amycolatopsis regifaucium]KZB79756.1 hypothetical protein AVL48_15295 [Amycolatopsis regifaucium]OKA09927.1 hypothetical protein ATP06_0206120 [Amycolatopsis regifaucium]SFI69013.1 hypothetical protein SAMN04489731_112162 [Amycolatopsis regifaucium]